MGILNYHDNHGSVEDWDLMRLRTAISIAKYMIYIEGAIAFLFLPMHYFNLFDAQNRWSTTVLCLLTIILIAILLLGVYALRLHISIKYLRRLKRK